jgi:N-carbamoyl-L-amino-acid hydrolase
VVVEIEMIHDSAPVTFPPGLVDIVSTACMSTAGSSLRISSGAGHDASLMAGIGPAGMIFVRTKDGRSHCPEEYAAPADINVAVDALVAAVMHIDARERDLVV